MAYVGLCNNWSECGVIWQWLHTPWKLCLPTAHQLLNLNPLSICPIKFKLYVTCPCYGPFFTCFCSCMNAKASTLYADMTRWSNLWQKGDRKLYVIACHVIELNDGCPYCENFLYAVYCRFAIGQSSVAKTDSAAPRAERPSRNVVEQYVCRYCGMRFMYKHTMKRHQQGHMCTICNGIFQTNTITRTHMAAQHGIKPHVCGKCLSSFSRLDNLQAHQKICTGNPHRS